jgi:hypothetical protein
MVVETRIFLRCPSWTCDRNNLLRLETTIIDIRFDNDNLKLYFVRVFRIHFKIILFGPFIIF